MLSRRSIFLISTVFFAGGSSPALAAFRGNAIKMFDTDADGTLDLEEVKKAASALFARLDRDHDGTLDRRELAGRLNAREFAAADPDHDGSIHRCRRANGRDIISLQMVDDIRQGIEPILNCESHDMVLRA